MCQESIQLGIIKKVGNNKKSARLLLFLEIRTRNIFFFFYLALLAPLSCLCRIAHCNNSNLCLYNHPGILMLLKAPVAEGRI